MGGLFNQLAVLIFVVGHACVGLRYELKPKQEFNFEVDGETVVGLTETGGHEGFEYRGRMTVKTVKENILHLQLTEFTYNKFQNKTVAPLPVTSAVIVVKLTKSQEPRLSLPLGRADWEVNFIKGLVSFITVSYGRDFTSQRPNYNSADENEYNSVIEDTVVGRCQVLYDVYSLPKQVNNVVNWDFCRDQPRIEIVKTVNYSSCEVLNEDSYGLPARYSKQRDDYNNFFTRASSTRLTGCGTKRSFVVVSSISESKIISKLIVRNSESLVSSRLNIKLQSMQFLQTIIVPPPDYETVHGLQYHYQCQDESSFSDHKELDHQILQGQTTSIDDSSSVEYVNLVYKRRQRSPRKWRKFPKYTHVGQGKPSNKAMNSDEYVSSMPKMVKTKLMDSTAFAPHDKPFSPFFLAHHFAVSCEDNDGSSTLHTKIKLNQLLDDIATDLGNATRVISGNTLEKISIATDYARLLSLQDLQELSKSVFENVRYPEYETQEAVKRNLFRDVLTFSGQRASFKLISNWIRNNQVDGEEAVQMVSALPSYLTPSDMYILEEFFDLMVAVCNCKDHQLRVTTILGFSNYVRVSTFAAGSMNENHDVKRYVDWLQAHLSDDENLQLAFTQAIGNIPGKHTLSILKSLAMERSLTVHKRSMAVFAMVYNALYYKLPTTIALMSMYHNESLPTPVRIAAVSLLFYSTQDMSIWQRIAVSTWFGEQTSIVKAFVWNTLQNLANNRDERYSFLIKAATQVKSMAQPAPDVTHQPFNIITASAVHKLNILNFQQLEWLDFSDFQSLYYRYSSPSSGLSRVNFQAELSAINFYGFLYDLISQPEEICQNTVISHSTEWIKNTLNIKSRVRPPFEANLHLKIDKLVERMFHLDKKGLDDLAKELIQLLNEIINSAKNFYYQKSGMQTSLRIATTTEMGFPVEFRIEEPWSIRTSVGLQRHSNSISFNITFMYASQMISDIGVYSSWDSTLHAVGIQTSNVLQLPHISLTARYDKETCLLQIKTKEIERSLVFYESITPFSVQREVQYPKPTIVGVYAESLYNDTVHQNIKKSMYIFQDSRTLFGLPIEIKSEGENSLIEELFRLIIQDTTEKIRNVSSTEIQRSKASHMVKTAAKPYKYTATVSSLQPMKLNFSIGLAEVRNRKKRVRFGKRITTLPTHQFRSNKLSSLSSDNEDREDGNVEPHTQYLSNDMNVLITKVHGPNVMVAPLFGTVTNQIRKPLGTSSPCADITVSCPPGFPQIKDTTSGPTTIPTEPSTISIEPPTKPTEPWTTSIEPLDTSTESLTASTEPVMAPIEQSTTSKESSTTSPEAPITSTEQWAMEPLNTSTESLNTSTEPLPMCTELWTTSTDSLNISTEPPTVPTEPWTTSTEPLAKSTETWSTSTEKWSTSTELLTTSIKPSISSSEPLTISTESPTAPTSCPPTSQQSDHAITETIHLTDYRLQLRKFNAESSDPFAEQIIGSIQDYLLLTVLDGLENGKSYTVDFNFTMGDVNFSSVSTYAFTPDNLLQRFGTFIKGNDYQYGLTATVLKPVTPLFNVKDFLDARPKSNLFIDFTRNGRFHDKIEGIVTPWEFDNSSSFDIHDCNDTVPGTAIGPDCRKLINQMSSRIGRMEFSVFTSKLGFPEKKDICIDFSQIYDREAVPLLGEPQEIRESCILLPNIQYSQLVMKSYEPAFCGITTRRIITFDKAEYSYSVSRFWHLAAQDCSGQRQVAILIRSSPTNTNMDIEVNVGNLAILTVQAVGGISFNSQNKSINSSHMYTFYSKEDEEDVIIMSVYRSPDNAIGIQLPRHGFDIIYAYTFIVINANPSIRGRLCGLCGSYTDEGEEKYLLPDGNQADSVFTFARSYDLRA